MKTNNSTFKIWAVYNVPQDEPLRITIGPLSIWCLKRKKELCLAWRNCEDTDELDRDQAPKAKEWQRWAVKQINPRIEIKPVFPDRPVLIKPENPIKITENARVRIYVRVPIWIRISLVEDPSTQLIEIPVVTLSNTWFGTYLEGDLCYWISSGTRQDIEADITRPYLTICPLQLINGSEADLDVEKICLRVEHLSMYYSNGQLWGGKTTMTYKGMSEISEVKYDQTKPTEAQKGMFISEPRAIVLKSLTEKTFSTIRDLPGFGLLLKE